MDILIEEFDGGLWVAALEEGRLEGMEIDPPHEEVRWGAIYYARVSSVNAALDAVFLDLDGDNTGILYNSDTRIKDPSGKIQKGGARAIGQRFQPGDMVAVQAKSAYIPVYDDEGSITSAENKAPQMSMDITLPGRYMIFCPMMDSNQISQRIRNKKLRTQIKSMISDMEDIQGCILRAAAAHTQTDILTREGKILKSAWEQIQETMNGSQGQLIMAGPDAIQRTLSDQAEKQIDRIEIVTMEHYNLIEEWSAIFAPDLITKILPIEMETATQDLALFHERDIIGQIESLFQSYALLPSGGNIIIQNTAALTVIDVNKGGAKQANLALNIEAAKEITRQLRLRNIGGGVIIDFLKFNNKKDEIALINALKKAADEDPCTIQIHGTTALGLVEISRKRRTPPLSERMKSDML